MVWYSLCLSIHPPIHLRLPQQNNLRPVCYCELPIAQWLEHRTGIWKVVGSILAKGSDFFLSIVPNSRALARAKHMQRGTMGNKIW